MLSSLLNILSDIYALEKYLEKLYLLLTFNKSDHQIEVLVKKELSFILLTPREPM